MLLVEIKKKLKKSQLTLLELPRLFPLNLALVYNALVKKRFNNTSMHSSSMILSKLLREPSSSSTDRPMSSAAAQPAVVAVAPLV